MIKVFIYIELILGKGELVMNKIKKLLCILLIMLFLIFLVLCNKSSEIMNKSNNMMVYYIDVG